MARIVGIDPGKTGAIACLDTRLLTIRCEALPVAVRELATTEKTQIDEDALAALLRAWDPHVAWIEDVFAHSGEGPVGAFSFGEGKGVLRGVLGALGVPRQYVSPQRWKGLLRCPADKQKAKALSHRYFPKADRLLKSSGKAEAALIALYGCLAADHVIDTTAVVPEQHHGAKVPHKV